MADVSALQVWRCSECDCYWADSHTGPNAVVACDDPTHPRMKPVRYTPADSADGEVDRLREALLRIQQRLEHRMYSPSYAGEVYKIAFDALDPAKEIA